MNERQREWCLSWPRWEANISWALSSMEWLQLQDSSPRRGQEIKRRNTAPRNSGESIYNGANGEKQNDNMYCSYICKWAAHPPGKLFRKIATLFKTSSCRLKSNMTQYEYKSQTADLHDFLANKKTHFTGDTNFQRFTKYPVDGSTALMGMYMWSVGMCVNAILVRPVTLNLQTAEYGAVCRIGYKVDSSCRLTWSANRDRMYVYAIKVFVGHLWAPYNSHAQDTSRILKLLVPNTYPRFQFIWNVCGPVYPTSFRQTTRGLCLPWVNGESLWVTCSHVVAMRWTTKVTTDYLKFW
jgi:hypothetical protein